MAVLKRHIFWRKRILRRQRIYMKNLLSQFRHARFIISLKRLRIGLQAMKIRLKNSPAR